MKHRNTRRYAVKTSKSNYARIISSHHFLGEAYKSLVKVHRAHFKHRQFPMAQNPIAVIVSEDPKEIILADMLAWVRADRGPPSKMRLPLPVVVYQWDHDIGIYQQFGEP